jgi:hypothetical protein
MIRVRISCPINKVCHCAKILFSASALWAIVTRAFPLRLFPILPSYTFSFSPRVSSLTKEKTVSRRTSRNVAARLPPPLDPGTCSTPSVFTVPSPGHCRCTPLTLDAARPTVTRSSASVPDCKGLGFRQLAPNLAAASRAGGGLAGFS